MFGDLLGAAEKLLGGSSSGDLQSAAEEHLGGLDQNAIVDHLAGMVPNLPDGARQEVEQLLKDAENDPSSLKGAAVSYITSNPQLVQQFAPGLMQGILARLGG
jgi:hypothetical protein